MWRFTARESLLKEMNKAKEKKDAEIDSLNREQSVLRPILNKRTIFVIILPACLVSASQCRRVARKKPCAL